ncbi:MAG TPA: hypothetical protein VMF88_10665 [Bacteroidota bacterium]|nr:hypothetical protein [Bacteroidota bacterium]
MNEDIDARAILELPFVKRLIWVLQLFTLMVGGLLIYVSSIFASTPTKAILFFFGLYIFFLGLLSIFNRFSYFFISAKHIKVIAAALAAWPTIAFFLIPPGTFRWLISAGIAFAYASLLLVSGMMWFFFERFFPGQYYKSYQSGEYSGWSAVGVVVLEHGAPGFYGLKILRKLRTAIMMQAMNTPFFFVNVDSFGRRSTDLTLEAINRTQALLLIVSAKDRPSNEFKLTIQNYMRICTGRIFVIQVESTLKISTSIFEGRGIQTFNFLPSSEEADRQRISSIISELTNGLTSTAIPIGKSDDELPSELLLQIRLLSTEGIPCLANNYLRFRLSQSNTERFLNLLDCIEVILKLSVMYLSVSQWTRAAANNAYRYDLDQPGLGRWIDLVKTLVPASTNDDIIQCIKNFLRQSPHEVAKKVIEDISVEGLKWTGSQPTTYLEWLKWFRWIRNITRGHGTVEEDQIAAHWHGFHAIFLDMVLRLDPLLIKCSFVPSMKPFDANVIKGWQRTSDVTGTAHEEDHSWEPLSLIVKKEDTNVSYSVYPFAILKAGDVLFWNGAKKGIVEYMNFTSGKPHAFDDFQGTKPYDLWKSKNAQYIELK